MRMLLKYAKLGPHVLQVLDRDMSSVTSCVAIT